MLGDSKAFSGFAVGDIEKAKEFYGRTLGLKERFADVAPPRRQQRSHLSQAKPCAGDVYCPQLPSG